MGFCGVCVGNSGRFYRGNCISRRITSRTRRFPFDNKYFFPNGISSPQVPCAGYTIGK
jgi:hypothetical protein